MPQPVLFLLDAVYTNSSLHDDTRVTYSPAKRHLISTTRN